MAKYKTKTDTELNMLSDELANRDILDMSTKAQRHLKREDLMERYTDKELEALLADPEVSFSYDDGTPCSRDDQLLANARYGARFEEQEDKAAKRKPRLIRKWHPKEDEFLRTNYLYISDGLIALALNVPKGIVAARRITLGLTKDVSTNLEVIIWCNRDSFEKDMHAFHLTKARPEAL